MQNITQEPSDGWKTQRRLLIGFAVLITLIGLFYAEEDVRGRLEWTAYQHEAAAKGIELDRHALEPAPVADEENFAMTPFLAPLLDYSPGPLNISGTIWNDKAGYDRAVGFATNLSGDGIAAMKTSRGNSEAPLTDLRGLARFLQKKSKAASSAEPTTREEEAAEILRDTEEYQPVLDELRAASQRPGSRFKVHYDDEDPSRLLLPHLAVLRRAGNILYYRASAELALGRKDAALDDLGLLISLANSIRTEPIMISQLVRVAMLNQAQQIVWEGLAGRTWDGRQLQDLQARLEKLTVLSDAQRALRWEHAEHGSAIFDLMRNNPKMLADDISDWNSSKQGTWVLWMRILPSGWSYLEQVSYNRIYDERMLGAVDASATQIHPQEIERNQKQTDEMLQSHPASAFFRHRVMATILIPSPVQYCLKTGFCQTMMDEGAIACALERYRLANSGQFPESLAALSPDFLAVVPHDVISGEPLKYRAGDGMFTLYSVGWNEKDDDGEIAMKSNGGARDLTKGDWAWPPYH